jgi:Phosphoribosyl transferase (PRTase)/PELOTA RNA binding domain
MGSYRPDDVTFLLTDLSNADLERPADEREREMQGGGHYSESLPREYRPSPEYEVLFTELAVREAPAMAALALRLADVLVTAKGREITLVSLARAGTPVGVLVRRALQYRHGIDAPHYSISIIRDRGIDEVALHHLVANHAPESLQFLDGWTGKGVINRELVQFLDDFADETGVRLDPELAVFADPSHSCRRFATRADVVIPSSCLNSTVSGLISRSVLNGLIGPGQFHGAKWYREFEEADLSQWFIERVVEAFPQVSEATLAGYEQEHANAKGPDDQGMQDVRAISAAYGLDDINLIKPGVGETTRVLLRRVPWKVLVNPSYPPAMLAHIRMLCEQRGVEIEEYPGMAYSCCGLIKPIGEAVQ